MANPRLAARATLLASVLALALSSCTPRHLSDAESWWSHVQYLASDSLEGRNTGSEGYRRAADYVARQFQAHGAVPGGTRGYFQPVEFITRKVREPECRLWLAYLTRDELD